MSNKNEVFEYLIDQLRQQMVDNPHKQQCEDLAHEVQSLKNQLRDASAQIKELHLALAEATGDVEAYKLIRRGGYVSAGQRYVVGEHGPEQSGCRKEDTHGCCHEFGYRKHKYLDGLFEPAKDCVHELVRNDRRNAHVCKKCGLKK